MHFPRNVHSNRPQHFDLCVSKVVILDNFTVFTNTQHISRMKDTYSVAIETTPQEISRLAFQQMLDAFIFVQCVHIPITLIHFFN